MPLSLYTGTMKYRTSPDGQWNPIIMQEGGGTNVEAIADLYDEETAYEVGAYVMHGGKLYRCIAATASGGETWTPAHWSGVSVMSEMTDEADIVGDGDLSDDFTATDLTGAVNELKDEVLDNAAIIGDGELSQDFTATDLTGAANELKAEISSSSAAGIRQNLIENWYFARGTLFNPTHEYSYSAGVEDNITVFGDWALCYAEVEEGEESGDPITFTTSYSAHTYTVYPHLVQVLRRELPAIHYTISALVKPTNIAAQMLFGFFDGESYDPYGTLEITQSNTVQLFTATIDPSVAWDPEPPKSPCFGFVERGLQSAPGSSMEIIAVKLEVGDTQTLAHQENGEWVLNELPERVKLDADGGEIYGQLGIHYNPLITSVQNGQPAINVVDLDCYEPEYAPSGDFNYECAPLVFSGENMAGFGYVQGNQRRVSGDLMEGIHISAVNWNAPSTSSRTNDLYMSVAQDGTKHVDLSAPGAWLNALGLGAVTTTTTISEIFTPSSWYTVSAATFASWGKIAMITVVGQTDNNVRSGGATFGTIVEGKRPAATSILWFIGLDGCDGYISAGDGGYPAGTVRIDKSSGSFPTNYTIRFSTIYIME